MKRLISFGCSNTYGDGLDNPDTQAWPSVLSTLLGLENVNNGVRGASNLEILYKLLSYNFQKDDTVVVMWTIVNRDYLFYDRQIGAWQDKNIVKHWMSVHDDTDLIVRSWFCIDHANQFLKNKGIQVYNFAIDYDLLYSQKPNFIEQTVLNAKVDVYKFIDKATDGMHPGPNAHINIAKEINNFINSR